MKILAFAPCNDWYLAGTDEKGKPIVFTVAGWATIQDNDSYDNAKIVGMIAVAGSAKANEMPKLVQPPFAINGVYLKGDQLSPEQMLAVRKG